MNRIEKNEHAREFVIFAPNDQILTALDGFAGYKCWREWNQLGKPHDVVLEVSPPPVRSNVSDWRILVREDHADAFAGLLADIDGATFTARRRRYLEIVLPACSRGAIRLIDAMNRDYHRKGALYASSHSDHATYRWVVSLIDEAADNYLTRFNGMFGK